jgi:hypothetical protein
MDQNNPLKQYFRRPAIYIRLPSEGKFYEPGVINKTATGELPVYPMTGIDEVTIRTVDGLFNGQATVDVIRSCIPDILDPWQLNSIDLEAVIIAIRAASVDGKMEIQSQCPSCDGTSKYDIDLTRLLSEKTNIDYTSTMRVRDLEIKFRPLNYGEINKNNIANFSLQRNIRGIRDSEEENEANTQILKSTIDEMNQLMLGILTSSIAYIKTPEAVVTDKNFIREFLLECDSKTNNAIKDHSIALRDKNDTKPLNIKCVHCNHEYNQTLTLNFTDFFV